LTEISVDATNPNYQSINGLLYTKGNSDQLEIIFCPDAISGTVILPNGVTSIGDRAFYNCSGLTSVTIPDSVTSIGIYAFYNCSSLTSVTIPNTVTSIGTSAFDGCYNVKSAYYTGTYAQWNNIYSPSSSYHYHPFQIISTVDNSILGWCMNSARWSINTTTGTLIISGGSGQLSKNAFWENYKSSISNIIINSSIHTIYDSTFSGFSNLTTVSIPSSVTSIGQNAFYGCSQLQTVYYGNSQEQWEKISISTGNTYLSTATIQYFAGHCGGNLTWTFDKASGALTISGTGAMSNYNIDTMPWYRYLSSIKTVVINRGVTSIGKHAFDSCGSLTSVSIPDTVTSIGAEAFRVSGLTSVYIPNSVTYIGHHAFCECVNLTSVTLPPSLTAISDSAFSRCYKLPSITIPNTVTSIGEYAFSWCSGLTSVSIPDSVTSIGDSAFYGCSTLKDVYYSRTETLWNNITIGSNNTPLTAATIHFTIPTIDFTPTIPAAEKAGIILTAPEGGWKEGTNTFTVACENACVVAVSYDGGKTYTRLTATATEDGYRFTADNMTADTIIAVVLSGDANGDGQITNADSTRTRAAALGKITLDALQSLAVDVNNSGDLTNADATRLRAAVLGKTTLAW